MNYLFSLIAAASAFAVGIAVLTMISVRQTENKNNAVTKLRIAASAIMAAGAAFGFCLVCIGVIAKSHGAENTVWTKATAAEIYNMNQNSHAIETKIEPQPGQLFAYVRYGCGDCMAVSKDLETAVKNSGLDFAGWYSTRTDLGKSLLEKYPVTMVPMLVWLDANGWAETCDPAVKLNDGSVKINADAIEIFFQKIKSAEAADRLELDKTSV